MSAEHVLPSRSSKCYPDAHSGAHHSARRAFGVVALVGLLCLALDVEPGRVLGAPITIETVPVGNAGNAPDPLTGNLYGSVSYDYRIGKYEVTNAQYAAFLNEKAKSDPLGLYNTNMASGFFSVWGGITRSGVSGSYTYTTKPNMADKPVNFVSWYDAIRFANWLHNGQGSGDTETGAYTILGGTATPTNGLSITRNPNAKWWLPSEDEWYKAAYYDPTLDGGDGGYWLYPTQSNSAPTMATANSTGDISNPGTNVANYGSGANWNSTVIGNVTTVGSAGPLSESYYGTSDQGGNLWEWNERLFGSTRGHRGGAFADVGLIVGNSGDLRSSTWSLLSPSSEGNIVGFRVATLAVIPEPSTAVLAIVGCLSLASLWRVRKRRTALST